jgi:hypothetical protein
MTALLEIFQREDNAISMGRVFAAIAFLMWVAITIYLVLAGKRFEHYDTLTMASIGFLVGQLFNKAIEWRATSMTSNNTTTTNRGEQH